MNPRNRCITLMLVGALLLASCAPMAEVGSLRSESHSVEIGDSRSVRVEVDMGAGDLRISGGAEKLLDADMTYNVDRLKPELGYTDGKFVLRQPEVKGLPDLRGISGFRNEWNLRLNDQVSMELSVIVGAGTSDLHLAGLSLTELDVSLGAGISTVDLSGDWARDLDVTIDSGAGDITVRLPRDVGARVEIDAGPTAIEASGLRRDGNVYTNHAYGASSVTLHVKLEAGIGLIRLEVDQ